MPDMVYNYLDSSFLAKTSKIPAYSRSEKIKLFLQFFLHSSHLLFANNFNGYQTHLLVYNMPGLSPSLNFYASQSGCMFLAILSTDYEEILSSVVGEID